MKEKTWVVVVNGSEGKIYSFSPQDRGLKEVPNGEFVGDKRPSREINTDRNGRRPDSQGVRMAMAETPEDPQLVMKRRFLQGIANFLEKARTDHKFARLVLIAPPKVLGLLRTQLSSSLREQVAHEIHKDLTSESGAMIFERLQAPARMAEERRRREIDDRRLGQGA